MKNNAIAGINGHSDSKHWMLAARLYQSLIFGIVHLSILLSGCIVAVDCFVDHPSIAALFYMRFLTVCDMYPSWVLEHLSVVTWTFRQIHSLVSVEALDIATILVQGLRTYICDVAAKLDHEFYLFAEVFSCINVKFVFMYFMRALVHWYLGEGMEWFGELTPVQISALMAEQFHVEEFTIGYLVLLKQWIVGFPTCRWCFFFIIGSIYAVEDVAYAATSAPGVCMCPSVRVRMCACVHVCICDGALHMCACAHGHVCLIVPVHLCAPLCLRASLCMCACACIYVSRKFLQLKFLDSLSTPLVGRVLPPCPRQHASVGKSKVSATNTALLTVKRQRSRKTATFTSNGVSCQTASGGSRRSSALRFASMKRIDRRQESSDLGPTTRRFLVAATP